MTDLSLPKDIHTVVLGMGDLNGIMRGKRIPANRWQDVCETGNACCLSLFTMDMTCDVWDTPLVNFENGFPDFHIMPATRPVPIPWEPGVAMCFGTGLGMDHKPVPVDPRQALVRQIERAAAMGIDVQAGAELEFYLLDPQTGQPRDVGNDCYGLERAASFEHVLGPIRQQIDAIGIPIEQSNPEYAPGQVEVNMRYDSALLAADRVVMFRSLVKQLATRHGYLASFMAKPFIDLGGNGFHLHYSLWSEGQNIFSDGGRLNDTGRHFLGGLQKRMVETSICGAANVNSYRRRVPYSFCPTNASWGMDNRTVALRVIEGSDSATRVEKRDAGADCNPYLLMATDIAAGLDGIEEKQEPTEITTGDAYSDSHDEALPTTLADAIRLARESDWLASVLGAAQLETWLQQAERELKFFSDQVTPFETDRYLRRF